MTRFFLGTHRGHWQAHPEIVKRDAALFISINTLDRLKSFHPALVPWSQDSGAFPQLQKHGGWTMTAEQYVAKTRRVVAGLGRDRLVDVMPMDNMCEIPVIFGTPNLPPTHPGWFHGTHELRRCKPGSRDDNVDTAVAIHQRLTAENGVELQRLAPDLPIRLSIQGLRVEHYIRAMDMYEYDYGIDLAQERVVGVGSVCRRQATREVVEIVAAIKKRKPGIRLHLYGLKIEGFRQLGEFFAEDENGEGVLQADSMGWGEAARKRKLLLDECRDDPTVRHKNCANCMRWALMWREDVLASIEEGKARVRPDRMRRIAA